MPFNLTWDFIFSWRMLLNIIDIAIVAVVAYQLIKIVRGTRINELLKGIFIILFIKFFSWLFDLHTTEYIIDFVIQWSALALIIIFQPELRRGLEHLGRGTAFSKKKNVNLNEELIKSLVTSAKYMSKRKIGALVSIEREATLDEYADTGISLNSDISSELLINIFIPNTPLHDGAVIIQNHEITSAASYLPLSESSAIPKKLGTRHRAAIGLSEATDAITLIVSEETGEISITSGGSIIEGMSLDEVEDYLNKRFLTDDDDNDNDFFSKIKGFFLGKESSQ